MAEYVNYNGTQFYIRPDGTVYKLDSPNIDTVNEQNITGKQLQRIKDYVSQKNAAQLMEGKALGAAFAAIPPPPAQSNRGSGGSGGSGGGNAPSKSNDTGATVPANAEKIDIRISDTINEELNRLTLEIINDSKDLIPFDLSFESIDFIPEREVFSADNETKYGIYFEDTETDQFIDVRNTESEDNSLRKIREKVTDLNRARKNGTRRYFDAFTVTYDSSGTPVITLDIDTGISGIDGLNVIILEIKDNIESFTRQLPPS